MIISKHLKPRINRLTRGFVLCLALVGAASSTSAQTLKMATVAPDGLAWIKQLRTAMKAIDQETEGRVKFKLYPGGVQGDDSTVLRKMRIGQLQGGALAAGALIRFYTDLQIYNMPLQFKNSNEVQHVRLYSLKIQTRYSTFEPKWMTGLSMASSRAVFMYFP